jgi:hypothetical protein
MPEKETLQRAREDAKEGKSASTQAGEFVREEVHHVREGKHGARSSKQAIAIGLSKARRAGVKLPARGRKQTRRKATQDLAAGRRKRRSSGRRSRAVRNVLKHEGRSAASGRALSRQARASARRRTRKSRSQAAKRGAATKGPSGRKAAARKAARTRNPR